MAYFAGDYDAAQRFYQGSLNINQDLGHQYDTALALSNLGLVAQKQQRFEDAVAIFEESIAIQRKIGYELGVGLSLRNLCATLLDLEALDAAATHLQEVLHLAHKIRNPPLGLAGLLWLAQLYRLRDDWPIATRLATVVHHHPATEDEIRTKAADLLVAAQSQLPIDALTVAVNRAEEADLWQVVAEMTGATMRPA
jgi:tetratricopeptide (TPR) repeat protein